MVKALDPVRVRAIAGGTKFLVHSRKELLQLFAKAGAQFRANVLLQEFIPGEDWMFDGYFDSASRCLFGVTGKKLRRFPTQTGVTSLGVCLHNETVVELTTKFMKAIGYQGPLDIGYRYDRRDGQYKVMDVNPRIGCTFRLLSSKDEIDSARAIYMKMTGQTFVASQGIEGRKWVVEDFDLISALGNWWHRRITVREWLKSFRDVDEVACFALDDPLPFLLLLIADCRELYRWAKARFANSTS
jgi:predicted ATP-grasp superfamily ATP-dependent carboligase